MPFPLETKRLILRPFQESDLESFAAYRSDPDVARFQSWATPYSMEQAAAFIQELQQSRPGTPGDWDQVALELKATGQMIGDCAFYVLAEEPRQAEIGFTLAQSFQGYGYAREAVIRLLDYLFGELNLHRVRANCDVDNLGSIKLLESLGMRREGHFVQSLWFKGRWSSEYWYAILQAEWRK
jgi:aminoglycoside 6'-N-acetyltransferase